LDNLPTQRKQAPKISLEILPPKIKVVKFKEQEYPAQNQILQVQLRFPAINKDLPAHQLRDPTAQAPQQMAVQIFQIQIMALQIHQLELSTILVKVR
jgi:hypothetical protein